jgi:HK97 family phage prohead protease
MFKILKKVSYPSGSVEAIEKKDPRALVHFMKLHCKGFKVETKADGSETVKIVGWASTPHIDRHDDIVEPSAFASSLDTFMKNPRLLLRHWDDKNIGNVTMAKIVDEGSDDERGLWIEAEVLLNTDDCITLIKNKMLGTLSIGFRVKEVEYRLLGDETGPTREIRVITDLDLLEISVVDIPANPNALFSPVKSVSAFFAAVRKAEADEALTQGAPAVAAPEKPQDDASPAGGTENAGETPATAQAAETPQANETQNVVEPHEVQPVEHPAEPTAPAQADPEQPTAEAQALAQERTAHAETLAQLATATAERDAAKAEAETAKADLAKASEELAASKKAFEESEKSKAELERKAAEAAADAEKANARALALTAKFSKVGKDPANVTKAAARSDLSPLAEACRLISAR